MAYGMIDNLSLWGKTMLGFTVIPLVGGNTGPWNVVNMKLLQSPPITDRSMRKQLQTKVQGSFDE